MRSDQKALEAFWPPFQREFGGGLVEPDAASAGLTPDPGCSGLPGRRGYRGDTAVRSPVVALSVITGVSSHQGWYLHNQRLSGLTNRSGTQATLDGPVQHEAVRVSQPAGRLDNHLDLGLPVRRRAQPDGDPLSKREGVLGSCVRATSQRRSP